MAKVSNLELRAVFIALLLVGGEGARIEASADMLVTDTIKQDAVATQTAFFKLGLGKPVCKDMTDATAAVQRYEDKRAKLTALSAEVLERNCIATCALKITDIKKRLAEFQSCSTLLANPGSMPEDLRSIITSSTSHSMQATMTQVSTDLLSLLKKNGMFPAKGACEFQPEAFHVEDAASFDGDMDEVRKSIFGVDCGSAESVETYIQSLSSKEKKALTTFMEKVSKMIETIQHAKETGEPREQEIAELELDIEDLGYSFLALSTEGGLEGAEGDGFAGLEVVIVLALLLVLGFWLTHWVANQAR